MNGRYRNKVRRVNGVPIPARGYLTGLHVSQAYNKGWQDGNLDGSYDEATKAEKKIAELSGEVSRLKQKIHDLKNK